MMITLTTKIGEAGFPLVLLRVRRAGAHAGENHHQEWAIIDTASARTFIDPKLLQELNIPAIPGRTVDYTTTTGEPGQAPAHRVSFWARGDPGTPDEKVLDGMEIGGLRPRVQRALVGMDFLMHFVLRIDGPNKVVELVLP